MDRRTVIGGMAGAAALSLGAPAIAGPRRRPNLIFIMTDDHAQSALGCYGNKIIRTPNLDRLAAGGVRFNQAFVTNALCLPSRATYLTGVYSHTHGMVTNGEESGFTGEPRLISARTYPNMLRAAGYHTGVVGKWHVNTPPEGYDYSAILPGQGQYFDPQLLVQGRMMRGKGHTDDVIGEQALGFLRSAPRDKPFCLLYQFKAPHRGWEPAPRFRTAYADVDIPPPADFLEGIEDRPLPLRLADLGIANMPDYRDRVPASLPTAERARRNWDIFIKDYYRVLMGVDENVGRVLDHLDTSGLAEDTLIVYTSDNGFFLGEHGLFDKRLMYEPSIRVPMLVRHPAAIPAGRVDDSHMLLNIDMAPTARALAGLRPDREMHGESWLKVARGERVPGWRKDFLYQYFEFPAAHCVRPNRGVRTDRWKLIHWVRPEAWELYDLKADPGEHVNLAGKPEVRAVEQRLKARLTALQREYGDVELPTHVAAEPMPGRARGCPPIPPGA